MMSSYQRYTAEINEIYVEITTLGRVPPTSLDAGFDGLRGAFNDLVNVPLMA
jgi:hypothetical protein